MGLQFGESKPRFTNTPFYQTHIDRSQEKYLRRLAALQTHLQNHSRQSQPIEQAIIQLTQI